MEKNIENSLLLDFYGELLTDKVRYATEMYYNDDLSLSEIADDMGITRQGVRDLIKRAEGNLQTFEEKLGLHKRFVETQKGLTKIKKSLEETKCVLDKEDKSSLIAKVDEMTLVVNELLNQE
ncbi:MAG: sigma factor-like helix-turn-helix DNA-binding protein [Ruminococcus bovis]|nr:MULTISPECIES: sigma factor-like helix-turn-helix DNA-binding protein [Ruminococcus]MCI5616786.1 DNA-binding protein [Ruminococcus sp.]MDY3661373.1 sigma factor-like helix-turn-helix DNA-binding protein [Ruminococcus bovis]